MSRSSKDPKSRTNCQIIEESEVTFHTEPAGHVLQLLGVTAEGLSAKAASDRLRRDGLNELTHQPAPGLIPRIVRHLMSPLTLILLVAGSLTFLLGEFIDTVVIALALLLAIVVGLLQEGKATKAFVALKGTLVQHAVVIRGGVRHQVKAAEVVVGDIIFLDAGTRIPADARVIEVHQLKTNEAPLTGESTPVMKSVAAVQPGVPLSLRHSMVYQGTHVSEGTGLAVVVATGDKTEVGKIARALQTVGEVDTPLQEEMRVLSQKLFYVIIFLIVAMLVIGVYTGHHFVDVLLLAVAVAVASVPEGLPAAVTIVLAVGMESLLQRGGLVRNLLAAETLGSTTYVLTDKTGTLTEGEMKLKGILDASGELVLTADLAEDVDAVLAIRIAHAASDAFYDKDEEGKQVVRGAAEERVVLETARQLMLLGEGSWRKQRIDYRAFSSKSRFAAGLVSVLFDTVQEETLLCINGAPEQLLKHTTHVRKEGKIISLSQVEREKLESALSGATAAGYRLIAVAYKEEDIDVLPDRQNMPDELVFVGVLVLSDPVRKGVDQAIAAVQDAGARVVLVTGDNPETALTIARAVGIAAPEDVALTGKELEELTDEELHIALKEVSVYARVLPEQKMRIAMVLQQYGEVVAMTGDGINDAPALRRANIGVATGSGTAVAKEASDLVLLNDSFDIMYAAIEEGRRIVSNLRKIVAYLISTSLSEVALILVALVTAGPIPLVPAQILWANIIEEGLMSVAFAFEPGEKGAMKRCPQDVHDEGLISGVMSRFMIVVVAVLGFLHVLLYLYVKHLDVSEAVLQSVMFLAVAIDSLFISFSFRSLQIPFWHISFLTNKFFVGSFLVSVVLLVGALSVPLMRDALSYVALPPQLILLPVITSVLALFSIELAKWFFFIRTENK